MEDLSKLEQALVSHDWYYRNAPDLESYLLGEASLKRIRTLMQDYTQEEATHIYNHYCPWGNNVVTPKLAIIEVNH